MIEFKFIIGGGPYLEFDYRIDGGPDNGRRISTYPEREESSLAYAKGIFTGTPEEFKERYLNRPTWAPTYWSQRMMPETILAATHRFGCILPAYVRWHSENVVAEWHEVAAKVFDTDVHDTRYSGGTASLYAAMLNEKFNFPDLDLVKLDEAANKFVSETIEWHEGRRHEFEPHPHFVDRILEIARDVPRGTYG